MTWWSASRIKNANLFAQVLVARPYTVCAEPFSLLGLTNIPVGRDDILIEWACDESGWMLEHRLSLPGERDGFVPIGERARTWCREESRRHPTTEGEGMKKDRRLQECGSNRKSKPWFEARARRRDTYSTRFSWLANHFERRGNLTAQHHDHLHEHSQKLRNPNQQLQQSDC